MGAFALSACFFGEETKGPGTDKPIAISPCVDVPAGVRAKADSLVAAGNREMTDNFNFWFSESDDWWEAKRRSPQGALDTYDKALAAAPGHCQAVFGKAMASASMITQEKRMDDFIRKVEAFDSAQGDEGRVLAKRTTFSAVFKTPPDQAATALIKLSASLEQVDPPTVKEAQDLIEQVIMPKLDSTIAALETIMDYRMFAVRFDRDGDTVEIDRGEIGPGLAGLKVAKAWLTVVAGYDLDPTPNGKYDWFRTLDTTRQEDFDHLSPEQKAALDHLTGLFKTTSPFTRMKPAWKVRINGIPALLLTAVGDAQRGIESVIEEARSGDSQRYDVWRAGSGEDADADTADLRGVIDLLERSKKYLTGEVPVEYDRGSRTLKVDFTRLFHIDGVQGHLPYFKFLPYPEWNDTLSADTAWGTYPSYEMRRELMAKSGFDPDLLSGSRSGNWHVSVRDSINFLPGDFGWKVVGQVVYLQRFGIDLDTGGMHSEATTKLALLVPDSAAPCTYAFTRYFQVEKDPAVADEVRLVADNAQGIFTLSGCRVQDGTTQYIDWIEAVTRGPLVFTDAAGTQTIALHEFEEIEDPIELRGKVVFRDPTFGGILPGQTNQTLWEHVSALGNSPGDRVRRDCRDVERDGILYWECTHTLPSNPSDLDYLVYYLDWLERVF